MGDKALPDWFYDAVVNLFLSENHGMPEKTAADGEAAFSGQDMIEAVMVNLSLTREQALLVCEALVATKRLLVVDPADPDAPVFSDADDALFRVVSEWTRDRLLDLVRMMRDPQTGIQIEDRSSYLFLTHEKCFYGSDVVHWLKKKLVVSRREALRLARLMFSECLIYHVLNELPFDDGEELYRFIDHSASDEDLEALVAQMRDPQTGVEIDDRRWYFTVYPKCFVGSQAVEWMSECLDLPRYKCLMIGQQLLAKGLIHHVCDEHSFRDSYLYYRFRADEAPSKVERTPSAALAAAFRPRTLSSAQDLESEQDGVGL